ncbi:hypothetical protein CLAFUW4_06349 [Fulvia fulva]|uniref:Uncharacterized protein n=1 Tax=Passalora fulva TaxID=5499 RepID=A0A9Q8LIM7_PASFU|nr:uncharacterized protein CLAFUR5_06493 [Fulvia fulva]KAK4624169.1 hypothetical protein CLAFUR4_06352 [Fulvia fulva]KAK4625135.1 hypothetical protein CLAFUR0_06354 [Fulvia fulva]UJO18102.1 hypothetical protein CLAFUR5_06493 [Fulvia fulva]WPV14931.1 hypothetical protein CLAFUW4_06349 [Fulvia fulva]WPV30323.1 hypothetical protein CLAFUW7_06347 [Fulvia fulva]
MRFINRGSPGTSHEHVNTTAANVVLQIGPKKMPIKADRLRGASLRLCSRRQSELQLSTQSIHDEEKAIDAFSRMEEELSGTTSNGSDGSTMPWSPDSYGMPSQHIPANTHRIPRGPLEHDYHTNPPPAYTKQMKSQQTAESAVRDMALHKGGPTIFDSLREAPPRRHSSLAMKQHQVSKRSSKTTGPTSSGPKKLHLVHLFPQPRPATGRLMSPAKFQHSPTGLSDRTNSPLPPLPGAGSSSEMRKSDRAHNPTPSLPPSTSASGTAGRGSRSKVFDEDIFDQHKTHVRRPPKGIQNWFDAFSDNDEDEDDVSEEEVQADKEPSPEPQELPAEDVLPSAYLPPSRHASRVDYNDHQHQTRSLEHLQDTRYRHEPVQERGHVHRSETTRSWDSIQSSHIGGARQSVSDVRLHSHLATDQSVLSVSESEYTDEDDGGQGDERVDSVRPSLPPIRDSIYDDRNIFLGSASALGVRRFPRPRAVQDLAGAEREHLRQVRSFPPDHAQQNECEDASHTSSKTPSAAYPAKLLPITSQDSLPPTADKVALRKLQGLTISTQTTDSSITANQEQQDARDSGSSSVPSDAAHMMAVTDEEMMLLDLMRRKRMMMQQMSFTEGYQLAMKTEQERLAKRTESAELRALKALRKREDEQRDSSMSSVGSPTSSQSAPDMRRRLSQIRKEQVDKTFHIQRFLSMSQPQPLASHPPEIETTPVGDLLPSRRPSGELLPATVYSPASAGTTSNVNVRPAMKQGSFASDEEIKRRVQHFIETKGAPPPLNTMPKTMQRFGKRGPASMPPSPVVEEAEPPAVPKKSPDRFNHGRNFSAVSQLTRKVSSVSLNDHEPRDVSPVSALPSRNNTLRDPFPVTNGEAPPPLPGTVEKAQKEQEYPQANLERSTTLVSQLTSSPTGVRNSPVSPFTNIINAATAPKPLSAATANWTPAGKARRIQVIARPKPVENKRQSTMYAVPTDDKSNGIIVTEKPVPEQEPDKSPEQRTKTGKADKVVSSAKPVCRLNTVEAIDQHGSLISITSAGEEVLAAWGDLGGGPGSLRTKLRVKPSGPLSGIMNSPPPR